VTRTRYWLPAALLAAMVAILSGCAATAGRGAPGTADLRVAPSEGAFAPDLALQDVNGEGWTLSGLKGKVVLLNFWATW
jgi:cytochrome oxidase Cu insertion factor (SCO1/SenC/PrrC family)